MFTRAASKMDPMAEEHEFSTLAENGVASGNAKYRRPARPFASGTPSCATTSTMGLDRQHEEQTQGTAVAVNSSMVGERRKKSDIEGPRHAGGVS